MERGGEQEQQLREGRKGDRKERPAGKMQCAVFSSLVDLCPTVSPLTVPAPYLSRPPNPPHQCIGGLVAVDCGGGYWYLCVSLAPAPREGDPVLRWQREVEEREITQRSAGLKLLGLLEQKKGRVLGSFTRLDGGC